MRQTAVSRGAWPVRVVIAGIVVAAMLFVALALVTISWYGFKSVLLDTAAMSARDKGQIAVQSANRMMEPNGALLRMLAHDPVVTAQGLTERLARSGVLADRLIDKPLISALLVGYENGDYLLIRPLGRADVRRKVQAPSGAAYMVQSVTQDASGKRWSDVFFYDAWHELLHYQPEPGYDMDPRDRPWYENALDQGVASTTASGPYVFYTTNEVGITLSRQAHTGRAVVAMDITLEDLGMGLGGLRMTPSAELALIDTADKVVGYLDMDALSGGGSGTARDGVPDLAAMGIEPLTRLLAIGRLNQPASYRASGEDWFGIVLPFYGIEGVDLRLLVAAPAAELLGDLMHYRKRMTLISVALILLFFPLGWRVGSKVGGALERLAEQARPMSYFDFQRCKGSSSSRLREVAALNRVMDNVAVAVDAFLSISNVLGAEQHMESMLRQVLGHLVRATRCQGGAVYLWNQDASYLTLVVTVGDVGGAAGQQAGACRGSGARGGVRDRRWESAQRVRAAWPQRQSSGLAGDGL